MKKLPIGQLEAVSAAGRPRVSSGSSSATSGSRVGDTVPILSAPVVVTTATAVASDPVPAVVGARISGRREPTALPTP